MRRLLSILLVAGALALAALWVRMQVGTDDRTSVVTGDGSRIRILATTFGVIHECDIGRMPRLDPIRRRWAWVRRILGEPTETLSLPSAADGLGIFYTRKPSPGLGGADELSVRGVVDEHGCWLPDEPGRSGYTAHGETVYGQTLLAYPRRAERFEVEFHGEPGEAGPRFPRVTLKNPRPWKGAEWTPEPLPVVRDLQGLRAEWLGWSQGGDVPWPRFRVTEDGVERPEWSIREIWFEDVTGNQRQMPYLCRHEPAWRIRPLFGRAPESLTAAEEVLDLGAFEIPGPGTVHDFEPAEERTVLGVRFRPLVLGGAGIFRFSSKSGWHLTGATNPPNAGGPLGSGASSSVLPSGEITVTLRRSRAWMAFDVVEGKDSELRWNLVAQPARGKAVLNQGWGGVGAGFRACDFELPPETRSVRLRFVVQRLRKAEFLVAPPPPGPGPGPRAVP